MSFNDTIDSVIASVNEDISTLNGLLTDTKNVTLRASNTTPLTPAPAYNTLTNTWTLTQNTANSNGIYNGRYRLPTGSNCTRLEIVNVVNHTNPSSPAKPVSIQDCASASNPTPELVDQPTLQSLDGACLNTFILRSGTPFQVEVALSDCITAAFEWESSASNTLEGCTVYLNVVLRLDEGAATTSAIDVDITNTGTATPGGLDYNLVTTSVTFPAGSVDGDTQTVEVEIVSDGTSDDNETIILGLDPDEGEVGDIATHTLTILPGGCSKTWSQLFIFNATNGMQGWSIVDGGLDATGLKAVNYPPQTSHPHRASASLTFTVPHSSVITGITLALCYSVNGSRFATLGVSPGSPASWTISSSPNIPLPQSCNGNEAGVSNLSRTAGDYTATASVYNGGDNNAWLQRVRINGTGINPFTGV